ncbi:hypothetical protein [Arthrobacter sp. H41]|uniref:hypothetical protein n=1 Tax=Arthrobacter sp. H41 TaxID=1312978 RepID=UPI0012DC52C4|nr:hypothetical protein [Arthrobacter sp. H41]
MIWHRIVITKTTGAGGGVGAGVASAFGFGLPLTITNNVYSLGLILDVDVEITMAEGATADQFKITVTDLPDKDFELLRSSYGDGKLSVSISLGYFDNPLALFGDHPVMRGRVVGVKASPQEDGHVKVEVTGHEEAGYVMQHKPASVALSGNAPLDDVVHELLDSVKGEIEGGIQLVSGSTLDTSARDYTIVGGSVLAALTQLTDLARKPLVIADGTVAIGPAVGRGKAPVDFDPRTNIAALEQGQQESKPSDAPGGASGGPGGGGRPTGTAPTPTTAFDMPAEGERVVENWRTVSVLGHPGLRVGQTVKVTGLDANPSRPVRISQVKHKYGTGSGYVCQVTLTDAAEGVRARPQVGPATVVDEWNRTLITTRQNNPVISVGQATAYVPGDTSEPDDAHRVTMNYLQAAGPDVTAPSVDAPVSDRAQLLKKPLASVFAFDKVGLMTPVYAGMRALVVHHRSATNDAIVAGWLWPTEPRATPPKNEAGDYWLALPTEIGSDGKPTGKGVNDLVDARGCRAVHARSLHILVGASALKSVGTRPTVQADDTIVIEHSSGTKITVASDGALSITTDHKGISLGNGSVTLKVSGSSVAVS